jgi:hypothetical protein
MTEEHSLDRRTKAYRDIISMMPKPSVEIEEVLDGEDFKYMPEPRCRVCTAADKGTPNGVEVRELINSLILYPKSVADIQRTIEPMMADWPNKSKITYKSIRTHQNKHLAWDRLAVRKMVEHWAQENNIAVIDSAGRMILTQEAWLEATAHFGWQRLLSRQLEPSWAETQKAFEQMDVIRKAGEGEFSTASLLSQLNNVIQVIREEIPPDRWEHILAKIEGREAPALPVESGGAIDDFDEIVAEQRKFSHNEEDV